MSRYHMQLTVMLVMLCTGVLACQAATGPSGTAATGSAQTGAARAGEGAVFEYRANLPLGNPDIRLLLNREGSSRVENPAFYDSYLREFSGDVVRWSREPGISINPNYVLSLFAKESGFDPRATSHVPANGVAQMTPIADADLLRLATDDPRWQWLLPEAKSWPRHPLVHDKLATKPRTDSLLRAGVLDAGNDYFFNPGTESRAAMLWLRMLADLWRGDGLDKSPAMIARAELNRGAPLRDDHVLDLVTVSYNQGYPYAMDLLKKHGKDWKKHLNEEASDYLERIRIYTVIFQNAR